MTSRKKEPTVTETLRRIIRDSGLSLYRVAKDARVSYATLFRFMAEERSITATSLDKLCASLGLTLTRQKKGA
jgi:hypothetical protein